MPATTTTTDATTDTVTTDATTAATATAPNIQAYWFTYDADNRVAVSGGSLTNGQIVVDDRDGSVAKTYDEAGDVVTELTYGGASTQTYSYDVRGEMIRSVLPGFDTGAAGSTETRQYDADGRLVADVYYYKTGVRVEFLAGCCFRRMIKYEQNRGRSRIYCRLATFGGR